MKIHKSIRFKLVVFFIVLEIVTLSLLIFNADRLILNNLTTQTYRQIAEIKSNLQASLLPLLIERDYASLDSLLQEYTNSKRIDYIVIVKNEKIIANSNWKENELPIESLNFEINSHIYNTSTDIFYLNQFYGKVYFGLNISFIQDAQNELITQSLIIALVEIVLSILLLLSVGYLLTKHLNVLTKAAEDIINNKFNISINIKSDDEFGLFAKIFNKMTNQISTQLTTIQKQNELKKAIFDNMAHILFTTNKAGVIQSFNKQAQILLGYDSNEVINKLTPIIFYDKNELEQKAIKYSKELNEDLKSDFGLLIMKTKKGLFNQDHWKYKTKDNKELIVKVTITALEDEQGLIDGYIIVAEDKTEKYYLEQSLYEETNRLKLLLANAGDCIHILDENGNIVMFSDSFPKSLGYTNEEIKNLNVKDWDADYAYIRELFTSPKTFESFHKRKDGSVFEVEIRTAGIKFDGKDYLYAASRDITDRKKAQEDLRKRDILIEQQARLVSMGEMIGNIAHQWRQPLSTITTLASGLKLKDQYDLISHEDISSFTDNVVQQANYLSNTIENFRDFIKNERLLEKISIKKSLESSYSLLEASLKNNHINFIFNVDDDFEVIGNINELTEAFINLINNSRDVIKEKVINDEDKIVLISSKLLNNDEYLIKIQDSGGGIDELIIDRIFEPYFTTKHKSQGTGLGLSMVEKIIRERHNGKIVVTNEKFILNEKEYFGACFSIYFKDNKEQNNPIL